MTCPLEPYGPRIVVEIIKTPSKIGSIYIPEDAERLTQEAEVLAVSPDFPCPVAAGDRIIYEKYGGLSIPYGGRDYLFLNEKEVLCVVER